MVDPYYKPIDLRAPWLAAPALANAASAGAKPPTFTQSAIRGYLAERQKNGLARHVRKIGGKVVVSLPGFYEWIAGQTEPHEYSDDGEQPPEEGPDAPRPERRTYRKGVR